MKKLLISVAFCEFAGIAGSLFTYPAIGSWYQFLNKPSFSPPNWVFAPVWTTLYAMMGVAMFLIWRKGLENANTRFAFRFFIIHLFLNVTWSLVFFGMQNIALAFAVIIALLAMIAVMFKLFWPIDRRASYLLIPYIAWVSFASVLNYSLMILN